MKRAVTLNDRIARIIEKHYVITEAAVGIYPERGYTDTRSAADEIVRMLGREKK